MNELSHEEKQIVLAYIFSLCQRDPSIVKDIIESATEGVKSFANKQKDSSSKMAFMMTQLLEVHPDTNFGPFKRSDILDAVNPWFEGTSWMNGERNKLTIPLK
jgi:uncharacterized protein (UPF0147 family)